MNCLILLIQRKVCFDRFLILTKNHSRSACLCKSLCTVLKLTGAKGVETSSEIERRDLPALFRSRILLASAAQSDFRSTFHFHESYNQRVCFHLNIALYFFVCILRFLFFLQTSFGRVLRIIQLRWKTLT